MVAPDVFAARGSPSAGASERGLTRAGSLGSGSSDTVLRMATRARAGSQRGRGIEREGLQDSECGSLNYLNSVSGQFGNSELACNSRSSEIPLIESQFR